MQNFEGGCEAIYMIKIILQRADKLIIRDLRNLHLQNRMQNRKIEGLPQNLRSPAKCRKILRFQQISQNLRFLCEICDIFAKFPVFRSISFKEY